MEKKELALPVEGFNGVNRTTDLEDLQPSELYSAKNLWERKFGTIETRWNSEVVDDALPSNVTALDNIHTMYKSDGTKRRFCVAKCTPDTEVSTSFPTGLSIEFVNDANGYWNTAAASYAYDTGYVAIRLVGYGLDKVYYILTPSISGYSASTAQKLRVNVTQDLGENVTGFEVYAGAKTGTSAVRSTPMSTTSTYTERALWCGFQQLISARTGTFDFLYAPAGYDSSSMTTGTFGTTLDEFTATASATGGTLQGGKTYYVCAMEQVGNIGVGFRDTYYAVPTKVDIEGSTPFVVAVTIPGTGSTGSISITGIETASNVKILSNNCAFCIGEDPRLLIPHGIQNQFNGASDSYVISSFPKYSPQRVYLKPGSGNQYFLGFNISQFSLKDTLIGVEDDNSIYPIFVTHMTEYWTVQSPLSGDWLKPDPTEWTATSGFALLESADYYGSGTFTVPFIGNGNRYSFQQRNDVTFFVNDFNPYNETFTYVNECLENYCMTDGWAAGPVPLEYESSKLNSLYMSPMKYIELFDSSIVLGGGENVVVDASRLGGVGDPLFLDSRRTIVFSQADNPYNFKDPGSAQIQFIQIGDDPEAINGLGIHTNTLVDTGPITQLVITKKNTSHLLNALSSSATLTTIAKKVGFVGHFTLVNTPIGLLGLAHDNVYLMRETGEPAPMAQQLSEYLKTCDMSRATACYHDRHVKFSFYDPSEAGTAGYNNVEWWLNISKVIEKKGGADWAGPMIGAPISYSFVEDYDLDGNKYYNARDRYCTDRENVRIFKADVEPAESDTQNDDFGTAITSEIESKEYDITQQDNNWNKLLKRIYWKIRTNKTSGTPLTGTQTTYINGASAETQAISFFADNAGDFNDQPLKLNRVFPASRLRGRTVRVKLSTTDRIAISGFQINYEVERRRI